MENETILGVVVPPTIRQEALDEASSLIHGDRQEEYGPPSVNFARIATIYSLLFPFHKWTPGDVALALLGLKLARAAQGYKRDTYIDLIGYGALAVEMNEE